MKKYIKILILMLVIFCIYDMITSILYNKKTKEMQEEINRLNFELEYNNFTFEDSLNQ